MKLSLIFMCATILAIGCASPPPDVVEINTIDAGISHSAPDDSLDGGVCDGGSNVWRHVSSSWILTDPKIHLIFWGDWWLTSQTGKSEFAAEAQAWNIMGNDPSFYAPVQEYGVGVGQFLGSYLSYQDIANGPLTEKVIQQEVLNEMRDGTLPQGDNQSLYIIMLPPDTQSQYDIDNNFGGHHGYINNFTYALIENHNNLNFVISHEIYEAATNPDTSNGWWGPGGETEIGDLCEGHSWSLDGYSITKVWSEAQCRCAPN